MAAVLSIKRILHRRRISNWCKVIALSAFFWWIVVYGFKQESSSGFGEHLDRNFIEGLHNELTKATKTTEKLREEVKESDSDNLLKSNDESESKEVLDEASYSADDANDESDEEKSESVKKDSNDNHTTEKISDSAHKDDQTTRSLGFSPPRNIFGIDELGENGTAVTMPPNLPPDIQKLFDEGWKKNSFNQYLSDLISFHRSIPDHRSDYCRDIKYRDNLPPTSVIITFHNEAWSTLVRSVHSVLDRSPEYLIKEIILVDDFSNLDHLKQPLDQYMSELPKVKIIRAEKREGLIRARMIGAVAAKGAVLTFLDSHIECTEGWLEPLLSRIAANPTIVVCPIIQVIDGITFQMRNIFNPKDMFVGGFDWDLVFRWVDMSESEKKRKKNPWDPTRSPTMAGGLFSIAKVFFEELGMYDPGFDIWGGENLELSFKIWMCGGSLEFLPCSQVGHIFREKMPYSKVNGSGDVFRRNSIRLAEVWLDEYAQYFYDRAGKDKGDFGNISDRVKLRHDLGCNSFKWYVENVYPNLKFPADSIAHGEIRNMGYRNNMCLDAPKEKEADVIVYWCHSTGGTQYWTFQDGFIKKDDLCIEYTPKKQKLATIYCKEKQRHESQIWTFYNETNQFYQKLSNKCLEMTKNSTLEMKDCDVNAEGQRWKLENLNPSMLKEFL